MLEARRCSGATNRAFACSERWRSAAWSATAGSGRAVESTSTYSIETVSGARYRALLASNQLATCAAVTGAVPPVGGGRTPNDPSRRSPNSFIRRYIYGRVTNSDAATRPDLRTEERRGGYGGVRTSRSRRERYT